MIKLIIKQNLMLIIFIILLLTIIWIYIYSLVYPNNKNYSIFVTASYVSSEYQEKYTDLDFFVIDESNTYYEALLQTNGLLSADLLIIEDTLFSYEYATSSFVGLTSDDFNNYEIDLTNYEYYENDGLIYGIVVKKDDINLFNDEMTFYDDTKTYYLVINDYVYNDDNMIIDLFMSIIK
jgi:hypothetical protein